MGCVHLVRHEPTKELRALKVMIPDVALDESARNWFVREIQNARTLQHPNVVRAVDAGVVDAMLFLEMEFCEGGSTESLLNKSGRVETKRAIEIILDVLKGLEYAHQVPLLDVALADGTWGKARGLIHRDLKPQNVFLTADGVAKVGDFGLSKAFELAGMSGMTVTGSTGGTVIFMPRQQVLNFKYAGPEVDVWAAAATFYYLLTGSAPRQFSVDLDPWQTVLETDAVPILKRGVDLAPALAHVIDQALVDRPGIHFKTAAEFRTAIEAACNG